MPSSYWQDLTTLDFAQLDPSEAVAVLPVAAIEQHGPHLPLATDALINEAMISETMQRLPERATVLVLPAMIIGSSLEHTSYAGTLSMKPKTLLAAWKQIGACVARAGIRKLVILNSHGGQKPVVDLAALHLRAKRGMFVARANYFAFGSPPGLFSYEDLAHDIHGGVVETSLMLHLRPDLVRKAALRNFAGLPHEMAAHNAWLGAEKPIGFGWMSQDLHPAGACGDAAKADPERGATYMRHLASSLVSLLGEVAATPLSVIENSSSQELNLSDRESPFDHSAR